MSISSIGGAGLSQMAQLYQQQVAGMTSTSSSDAAATAAQTTGASSAAAGSAAAGPDFAGMIGSGLQQVASLDQNASSMAVQAATGNLSDIHDYVIAASQAQTATELTTTVRNKALDAFNEIMRMSL
jgi:flagellar hook-basal body complex protein FliE